MGIEKVELLRNERPDSWRCPKCGILFTVYQSLPFNHICDADIHGEPSTAMYYYRLDGNGQFAEFCVVGSADPSQTVSSLMPNGEEVYWDKRYEGDLLVFRGPKDCDITKGIAWNFDRRLQAAVKMPDEMLHREAMRCRVSA